MKRDYFFVFTIKPSRIYLERYNLKKLEKKFHLKLIYIKNPEKIKYCNLINKNLKYKKTIKFSSLAKKSKKIYLSVIANFESDKLEIYNHCRAYENIKIVDFYMHNYSYSQSFKHLYEVLKQNLANNIFTNINFILFLILKIILVYFKNIIIKKKKDIKLDYLFYSGSFIKKKN